jgi:uncharacterized protein Smg (DUF494 family)
MNANNSLEQSTSGPNFGSGRERIMEIVFFLLSEIKENKALAEIDLKPLSVRGFSEIEISTAFSWLIDKFSQGSEDPLILSMPFGKKHNVLGAQQGPASFRVYHEIESSVISREARGFMMQMLELGILSDSDLEFMIDRIMLSGVPDASLEEVKEFVSSMIFHFDAPYAPRGRVMLSGSDRVH